MRKIYLIIVTLCYITAMADAQTWQRYAEVLPIDDNPVVIYADSNRTEVVRSVHPKEFEKIDVLKLVKEYSTMVSYVFPSENIQSEKVANSRREIVHQNTYVDKYVLYNNTDDYSFVWFGPEDFKRYMFRPLFDFSIMSIMYEYGSTLTIQFPSTCFVTPFWDFIKIVRPHEQFTIYIFDRENDYTEELVENSIRYISLKETFLSDDKFTLEKMLNLAYNRDEIIVDMKSFLNQPIVIKGGDYKFVGSSRQ